MIIIDTHIWIWWVQNDSRLTAKYRQWLTNYESQGLGLSVISCWEVAKLVEKDRLLLPVPVDEWLNLALAYPKHSIVKFNCSDYCSVNSVTRIS